jgi:hypothetical protein
VRDFDQVADREIELAEAWVLEKANEDLLSDIL